MEITAHSGCDNTPMNSMQFIRHALQLHVDALEVDVRLDATGRLILSHDRATAIEEAVSLESVFRAIAPHAVCVNCDLKERGLEQPVLALAGRTGIPNSRIVFSGAVTPYTAGDWPRYMKDCRVFLNIEELIPSINQQLEKGELPDEQAVLNGIRLCAQTGCAAINVNFEMCTPAFCAACRKEHVKISAWTVTTEADIRRILPLGVYNITSRAPSLVKQLAQKIK